MEMKWMYLILYSVYALIGFFFLIPGEGGTRVMLSVMSGSCLPQRHYCLGERTSVAFLKSCMSEQLSACGKTEKKKKC